MGFCHKKSDFLKQLARETGHTAMHSALDWQLKQAPTILFIPYTSTSGHLLHNRVAAGIELSADVLSRFAHINTAGSH
ncbi:MAG: hypothetical protein EBU34_13900 [Alphaproteobacteria bacterium]|nr:hypothetical protein [Alphaproteobacteria bacterium]